MMDEDMTPGCYEHKVYHICSNSKFYRPKHVAVPSDFIADTIKHVDAYVNENCQACGAPHGHYVYCPTINRASAEAWSAMRTPDEAERILAHGLGVQLD